MVRVMKTMKKWLVGILVFTLAVLVWSTGEEVKAEETVAGTLEVQTALITAAQLNRTLVQSGVDVEEIHEKKQSLEELYLQLTGGAEIE